MPRVFFVTGCSSGFGRELVQVIINNGDHVVATARKPATLAAFANTSEKNFLAVKLDIKNKQDIDAAFDTALKKFGRIDVVVNNAGYGVTDVFEKLSSEQMRAQFDTNFFGVIEVTRRAIEVMRAQSPPGGVIQQNSSIAAYICLPLMTAYSASKAAINGFTQALAGEMKPEWKIKFNIIEPGPFRTEAVASNLTFGDVPSTDYPHLDAQTFFKSFSGTEPGDPKKGAEAMYKVACMEDPPMRVILGKSGLDMTLKKFDDDKAMYQREDVVDMISNLDYDVDADPSKAEAMLADDKWGSKS